MNKTCPSPEPDQYVPPSGAAGQAVVGNNSRHGLPTSPSARRPRSPRSSPHPHGGGSVKRKLKGMPCTPSSRLLVDAATAAAATAGSGMPLPATLSTLTRWLLDGSPAARPHRRRCCQRHHAVVVASGRRARRPPPCHCCPPRANGHWRWLGRLGGPPLVTKRGRRGADRRPAAPRPSAIEAVDAAASAAAAFATAVGGGRGGDNDSSTAATALLTAGQPPDWAAAAANVAGGLGGSRRPPSDCHLPPQAPGGAAASQGVGQRAQRGRPANSPDGRRRACRNRSRGRGAMAGGGVPPLPGRSPASPRRQAPRHPPGRLLKGGVAVWACRGRRGGGRSAPRRGESGHVAHVARFSDLERNADYVLS